MSVVRASVVASTPQGTAYEEICPRGDSAKMFNFFLAFVSLASGIIIESDEGDRR
jgi:hypothetical protein